MTLHNNASTFTEEGKARRKEGCCSFSIKEMCVHIISLESVSSPLWLLLLLVCVLILLILSSSQSSTMLRLTWHTLVHKQQLSVNSTPGEVHRHLPQHRRMYQTHDSGYNCIYNLQCQKRNSIIKRQLEPLLFRPVVLTLTTQKSIVTHLKLSFYTMRII